MITIYRLAGRMSRSICSFLNRGLQAAKLQQAHRLFESVSQLEELLNKLLNVRVASRREGGLIIKLERKIKNKGNAVY